MTKPRTKLSEAPMGFNRRFAACKPELGEQQAWRAKFGEMVVRVSERDTGFWCSEAEFRGVRVFGTVSDDDNGVVRGLEKFLKVLKRAMENIP